MYHVKPSRELKNAGNFGGAYVSCWIEANSIRKADKIAKDEIGLAKWNVLERDDAYEIKEEYYSNNSVGLEFYKQALIHKWVLRIHTYPIE